MKERGVAFFFLLLLLGLLTHVHCLPYQKQVDICEEFVHRLDCYYFACIDSIYQCGSQNILVQFSYLFCKLIRSFVILPYLSLLLGNALLERISSSLTSSAQIWAKATQQCLMHEIDSFLRQSNSSVSCATLDRLVLSKYPVCLTRSHSSLSLCSIMCNNLKIFLQLFDGWNLNGLNLKRLLIEASELCPEKSLLKNVVNLKDTDIPIILWSVCLDSLTNNVEDFQANEVMIESINNVGIFTQFFDE